MKNKADVTHGGATAGLHSLRTLPRASDDTIRDIARQVSKQMLKHYSHIGMEAKRRAGNLLTVKVHAVTAGAGTISNRVAQAVPTIEALELRRATIHAIASQLIHACGWR